MPAVSQLRRRIADSRQQGTGNREEAEGSRQWPRRAGRNVLIMSWAPWETGGGNQRPTAMAQALAQVPGWAVYFYNDSDHQRTGLVGEVYCMGPDRWADLRTGALNQTGLLIAAHPCYYQEARDFKAAGWTVVYDCIDDWEAFAAAGAIRADLVEHEAELVALADHVMASAPTLCDRVRRMGRQQPWLIANAGPSEPVGVNRQPSEKRRVVYAGHLDNVWLDWRCFEALANQPDIEVTIIGRMPKRPPCPGGVSGWSNYAFTGLLPYQRALEVMAQHDVGIVPFRGAIAAGVDPIKYYDYAAAGLWTVATEDVQPMRGRRFATVCAPGRFLEAVRSVPVLERGDRRWMAANSWDERVSRLLWYLEDAVEPGKARVRPGRIAEEFTDFCDVKLRLAWACSARCNAEPPCPYCCTREQREAYGPSFVRPPEEIVDGFLRLTDQYGPFHLLSGWGDGMADDQVAGVLGAIARRNRVDITTNLRFPRERLDLLPSNGNVNFCLSFHPHLWPGGVCEFLEKALWLRDERRFPVAVVGIVGYPPNLEQIPTWAQAIAAEGFTVNAIPFGGWHGGRKYPESFGEREWAMFHRLSCEPSGSGEHAGLFERTMSPRGLQCWTGVKYLYLDWYGNAHRCVGYQHDGDGSLGDLFGGVHLWDGPRPCEVDVCTCSDLWQYIEMPHGDKT